MLSLTFLVWLKLVVLCFPNLPKSLGYYCGSMKSKLLHSAFPKSIRVVRASWLGVLHKLLTGAKHCLCLNCGCESKAEYLVVLDVLHVCGGWDISSHLWNLREKVVFLNCNWNVRTFQCKNIAAVKLLGWCEDLHWHLLVPCEPFAGWDAVMCWCSLVQSVVTLLLRCN